MQATITSIVIKLISYDTVKQKCCPQCSGMLVFDSTKQVENKVKNGKIVTVLN
jgi:uncharacterized protein with PIN domain